MNEINVSNYVLEKNIGFLIYAKEEQEARSKAAKIFQNLLCMSYSDGSVVACRRLENDSDSLVIDYINTMKSLFLKNLERIKNVLSIYTMDQVFELMEYLNRNPNAIHDEYDGLGLAFYQCSLFPQSRSINLFDNDGQPLISKIHLSKIFKEWKPKDKHVWIVLISPFG